MSRKRRRGKGGNSGGNSGGHRDNRSVSPSKAPSPTFDIGEEADQAFIAAMKELDSSQIPSKDLLADEEQVKKGNSGGQRRTQDGPKKFSIDLHGYTLREANDVIGARISQLLVSESGIIHIRVVTGKGRHSGQEGSVLARDVHAYVVQRFGKFIQRIDSAPADVIVGGLPIRGHFDIVLRCL